MLRPTILYDNVTNRFTYLQFETKLRSIAVSCTAVHIRRVIKNNFKTLHVTSKKNLDSNRPGRGNLTMMDSESKAAGRRPAVPGPNRTLAVPRQWRRLSGGTRAWRLAAGLTVPACHPCPKPDENECKMKLEMFRFDS